MDGIRSVSVFVRGVGGGQKMSRIVFLLLLTLGISKAAKLYRTIESELQHDPNFRYGDIQVYETPDEGDEGREVTTEIAPENGFDVTEISTLQNNDQRNVELDDEVVKDAEHFTDKQKEEIYEKKPVEISKPLNYDDEPIDKEYSLKSKNSKYHSNHKHFTPNPAIVIEKPRPIQYRYVLNSPSLLYVNAHPPHQDISETQSNLQQGQKANDSKSENDSEINMNEDLSSVEDISEYSQERHVDENEKDKYQHADVLSSVLDIMKSNEESESAIDSYPYHYYITNVADDKNTLEDINKPNISSAVEDEKSVSQHYGIKARRTLLYSGPEYSEDFNDYPKYEFGYSVSDHKTQDHKSHHEQRDGDVVKGVYTLVEPDGSIRKVEYSADDEHGFNAVVSRSAPAHSSLLVLDTAHIQTIYKPQFKRNTSSRSINRRKRKHQRRSSKKPTAVRTR